MKKYRWQLLILFLTGLIVGTLLILERRGGLGEISTPQPIEGGVYTEALIGNMQRLNPLLDENNSVDRDVDRLIFSSLVSYNSDGTPEWDLAKSIGVSQDGILYNIALKEDLIWHDGKQLTTKDIQFTIDLMRDGGEYIPEDIKMLWNATEVRIFDELNMQIQLPESFAPFMDYLAFGILPEHIFGQMDLNAIVNSTVNLQPIGSGPYAFSEFVMDGDLIVGVTLKAFDKYYGTKPFLQEIVFRYYPDTQSALQAFQDGYVQGVSEIPSDYLASALSNPDISVYTGRLPLISLVMFNLNDQGVIFLQDAQVRLALLMGINRSRMIDSILDSQAIQANGVILPGTWAYSESTPVVAYDQEGAATILKDAGYVVTGEENPVRTKEGTEMKFVLSYPDDEQHRQIAEFIAADWKKLDVIVTLEPVPTDLFIGETMETHAFHAALVDLNFNQTPDPDPYPFWDLGQAAGGQNYTQWNNRTASNSLEQARVTVDMAERMRLYHNFQAIFAEELPALPLFYPVYNYAVATQIQGVSMGPLFDTSDRLATINTWYITAKRNAQTAETPTGN